MGNVCISRESAGCCSWEISPSDWNQFVDDNFTSEHCYDTSTASHVTTVDLEAVRMQLKRTREGNNYEGLRGYKVSLGENSISFGPIVCLAERDGRATACNHDFVFGDHNTFEFANSTRASIHYAFFDEAASRHKLGLGVLRVLFSKENLRPQTINVPVPPARVKEVSRAITRWSAHAKPLSKINGRNYTHENEVRELIAQMMLMDVECMSTCFARITMAEPALYAGFRASDVTSTMHDAPEPLECCGARQRDHSSIPPDFPAYVENHRRPPEHTLVSR